MSLKRVGRHGVPAHALRHDADRAFRLISFWVISATLAQRPRKWLAQASWLSRPFCARDGNPEGRPSSSPALYPDSSLMKLDDRLCDCQPQP